MKWTCTMGLFRVNSALVTGTEPLLKTNITATQRYQWLFNAQSSLVWTFPFNWGPCAAACDSVNYGTDNVTCNGRMLEWNTTIYGMISGGTSWDDSGPAKKSAEKKLGKINAKTRLNTWWLLRSLLIIAAGKNGKKWIVESAEFFTQYSSPLIGAHKGRGQDYSFPNRKNIKNGLSNG